MRLNSKLLRHFLLLLLVSIVSTGSLFSFDAAVLQSPTNNAICQEISTEFTWTVKDSNRVMNYVLQVSAAQDFSTFVTNQTVDTNVVTVDLPNFSTDYFWRVITTFDDYTTEYSMEYTFATETEPVVLTLPDNNTSCLPQNVEFSWTEADASNTYEIWISTNVDFTDTIHFEEVDTNFYIGHLSGFLTEYFWKVRREYLNCKSDWSQTFRVTTAAQKPIALTPANNASNLDVNVNLLWSADVEFQNYQLMVADKENFDDAQIFMTTDTSYSVSELAKGTMYFWKVKGDTNSCWSDYSDVFAFWTRYEAPATTLPEHEALCVDINAAFEWTEVPNADAYQIQIAYTTDFVNHIAFDVADIDTNFVVVPLDRSNYEFFWRVRAMDAKNTGEWSEVHSFTSALLAPVLTFPAQNMTGISKIMEFAWSFADAHDNYRLQLSKDSNFVDTLLILDTLTGINNSFAFALDTFNTNYFWRVKAMLGDCESEWTETHKFRTSIGAPELTFPADGAIDVVHNVLFRWTSVPLAETYVVEVATDSLFANPVTEVRDIPANSVQAAIFAPNTKYWWRVYARNAEGNGPWSQAYAFTTIIAGPAKPMLEYPAKSETKLDTNITFTWFTTEGADSYELQIAERDAFVTLTAELKDLADTTASYSGLKNNTQYYWRVRALNDSGYSQWSEPWKFRTIMKAPEGDVVLVFPADNATEMLTDITLEWAVVPNALYYHVQVAKDNQFGNMVYEKENYWTNDLYLQDLDYNTTYFWRIKAYNEAGETTWSPVYSFTTEDETSVADYQEFGGDVNVYPNPAQTETSISLELSTLTNVTVDIFDASGSKVIALPMQQLAAGTQTIRLNVSDLVAGVYTYTIVANDKFINGRFVVYR